MRTKQSVRLILGAAIAGLVLTACSGGKLPAPTPTSTAACTDEAKWDTTAKNHGSSTAGPVEFSVNIKSETCHSRFEFTLLSKVSPGLRARYVPRSQVKWAGGEPGTGKPIPNLKGTASDAYLQIDILAPVKTTGGGFDLRTQRDIPSTPPSIGEVPSISGDLPHGVLQIAYAGSETGPSSFTRFIVVIEAGKRPLQVSGEQHPASASAYADLKNP